MEQAALHLVEVAKTTLSAQLLSGICEGLDVPSYNNYQGPSCRPHLLCTEALWSRGFSPFQDGGGGGGAAAQTGTDPNLLPAVYNSGGSMAGGGSLLSRMQAWLPLPRLLASCSVPQLSQFHTSTTVERSRNWEMKNRMVYPPQAPEEPRRPAEIFHCRKQIKYSKDKMWYLAKLIQGMSIDQALAQLEFSDKKGAKIMREVLLEAQELAVRNHNVEYKSNLYLARSFSNKGMYLKRIRYHGRGMFGIMDRVYCHYYVKLVEGPPPPPEPAGTGFDQAKQYVQQLRNRTIIHGL